MPKEHTSRIFDGELNYLHCLMLEMGGLVIDQLQQTLHALRDRDVRLAGEVIARDRDVDNEEMKIDNAVMAIIAKRSPVANDLRMVISVSKIVVNLEQIGDEIVKIAKIIVLMAQHRQNKLDKLWLDDIVQMGEMVAALLKQVILFADRCDLQGANTLFNEKWHPAEEIHSTIHKQLALIENDPCSMNRLLYFLQIMQLLERCSDHSRGINEYLIFMIEGKNYRHRHGDRES